MEVSLQKMIEASESKEPLMLIGQNNDKQQVGRLYVDRAVIGYPIVDFRAATTKGKGQGLVVKNCCPVQLKVLVVDDNAAFEAIEVGFELSHINHSKCIVISASGKNSNDVPRFGIVTASMLGGNSEVQAMLLILNESNLVVGKKSVSSMAARDVELYMDLEKGGFALSAINVKAQLLSTYQRAVERIGDISSTAVDLSDEDVEYFLQQKKQSEKWDLRLPLFGRDMQKDCMSLDSYQAFIEQQMSLLKKAISKCDFMNGDGDQVELMSSLLKKMHIIDMRCGNPAGKVYNDMVEVLLAMLSRLSGESKAHLEEQRYAPLVHALSVLKRASTSELIEHLSEEDFIAKIYNSIVNSIKQNVIAQQAIVEALLSQRTNVGVGFCQFEADSLRESWERLTHVVSVTWDYEVNGQLGEHLIMPDLAASKNKAQAILIKYSNSLVSKSLVVLNALEIEGKLGQCKFVLSEATFIFSLPGLEALDATAYEDLIKSIAIVWDATENEMLKRLRQVAVYSGSDWTDLDVTIPSLEGVSDMFQDLVQACEWTRDQGLSLQCDKILESVTSVIKEVRDILLENAKASAVGSNDDRLFKVLYVADQFGFLEGITDKHSGVLLSRKIMGEIEEMIQKMGADLTKRVKFLYPWHEQSTDELDTGTVETIDTQLAEEIMMYIDSLVAYAKKKGALEGYEVLDGMFKGSMRAVIFSLKCQLDKDLPTVNADGTVLEGADGTVQFTDVQQFSLALRAGAGMKQKHPRLFGLGSSGDFMHSALKNVGLCYDKFKAALSQSNNNTVKTERLLQVVHSLCFLDDALEDEERMFAPLYRQYEVSLRVKVDDNVNAVLLLIEENKFSEVRDMMEQHGLKASVPRQITFLLSNKVEADLEVLQRKLQQLSSELPVDDVDSIYDTYKKLKKVSCVADIMSEDVCKKFKRVMSGEVTEVTKKLGEKVKAVKDELERLLSSDQLGKAACLVKNIGDASVSLQDMLGDEISVFEADAASMLKDAVAKTMLKIQQMPLEKWPYEPLAALLMLFEGDGPEALALKPCAGGLEAVWKVLEQKALENLASSYLGAGSKEAELLKSALHALPDGNRRVALLKQFEEGTKEALGQLNELSKAVKERDAAAILDMGQTLEGTPMARKQLLETIEGEAVQIQKKWIKALEENPADVMLDNDFITEWTFVVDLKDLGVSDADPFKKRMDKIKEGIQQGLAAVERKAASTLSCLLDKRNLDKSQQRFRDFPTALNFLKRVVKLKVMEGTQELGLAILPLEFGARTRDVLRQVVVDFKKQVKKLTGLLLTQTLEKAVDVPIIALCLSELQKRAQMYTESRVTLEYLDSALDDDTWTVQNADFGSINLLSIAANSKVNPAALEWDPETWEDIDSRMCEWVKENFQAQPDFKTKIKIPSDYVLFFELVGRRATADSPELFSQLLPFVSNSESKALLVQERGFQEKVVTAARQLWGSLEEKCDRLQTIIPDATIYKRENYCNKSDVHFHQAIVDMGEINELYDAVKLYKQHVAPCVCDKTSSEQMDLQSLSDSLLERVNAMVLQMQQTDLSELDMIAGLLITMHAQSKELLFQKSQVHTILESALDLFMVGASAGTDAEDADKGNQGEMAISKVGLRLLDPRFQPAGESVVNGYEAFKGIKTFIFNSKTKAYGIDYVTENIKMDEDSQLNVSRLNADYKAVKYRYEKEIGKCITEGLGDVYLVQMIQKKVDSLGIEHQQKVDSLGIQSGNVIWSAEMKSAAPELIALIFAVWTLHHSKKFLKNVDPKNKLAYLFQPHPVQVVAIFCLLGIDCGGVGLERSLIQVRTGEGKSAVLGVASSLLALYKCHVSVACYSEYLSQRDGENIAFLFNALGVTNDINYMTLTNACEYEINKTVNIREALQDIIMQQPVGEAAVVGEGGDNRQWKPRVLLVDEVDVFFSESFYGSTYVPSCELRHDAFSNLLREIYKNDPGNLKEVKEWQAYKNACDELLQKWHFLVGTVCLEKRPTTNRHDTERDLLQF